MEAKPKLTDGPPFAPAGGWTAPSELPPDVAAKILLARDALTHYAATSDGMRAAISEAYHQLYMIADPECLSFEPWQELEKRSN